MTRKEVYELIEKLQSALNQEEHFPCLRRVDGQACETRLFDTRDDEGRPALWYGSDCKLPAELFCPACLAHWHVAVARNCLITLDRISPEENERHGR